jgi:uncharacterized membrane protein YgdD (TMEM256/DUF423 family)
MYTGQRHLGGVMQAYRGWVALGAFVGLIAVIAAAAAAHGADPAAARARASAAQMLGWHALAIVAVGLWGAQGGSLGHAAGALFTLGLALFCAAVYSPTFGGPSLGMTAPAGGILLMLGWAAFGLSALLR